MSQGRHGNNRLSRELSPYLLHHAGDPVAWQPWDAQAFQEAEDCDKPIFLSIGYSSCYWCQVMSRESFRDPGVAQALNRDFVSIKVDREERPDLDLIYSTASQVLVGHSGWPLTLFLTPEGKPFFAASYLPRNPRRGLPGLLDVLDRVHQAWRDHRGHLEETGELVARQLRRLLESVEPGPVDLSTVHFGYQTLAGAFDSEGPGFGPAPRFPSPHQLSFLLLYGRQAGVPKAREMALAVIEGLAKGGIRDQVGGGFSRYTTDANWVIPHFEKMLIDNALLSRVFLEAWVETGHKWLLQLAVETLDYIQARLTSSDGGFYTSENAVSNGQEGAFYTWTPEEIEQILGTERGKAFCAAFDVTRVGHVKGRSVLNLVKTGLAMRQRFSRELSELASARERRKPPSVDEKVLTGWNGLMLGSFARAGALTGRRDYLETASRAATFIKGNLWSEDEGLLAAYRSGRGYYSALLEDYSYLVAGLLELYQGTQEPAVLSWALEIQRQQLRRFKDSTQGGFYQSPAGRGMLAQPKPLFDGAWPSGNSVLLVNLVRLGYLTGDSSFLREAAELSFAFGAAVNRRPKHYAEFLSGLLLQQTGSRLTVLAGDYPGFSAEGWLQTAAQGTWGLNHHVLVPTGKPNMSRFPWDMWSWLPQDGLNPGVWVMANEEWFGPYSHVAELNQHLQNPV